MPRRQRTARARTRACLAAAAVVSASILVPAGGVAFGQEPAPVPNTFGVRLEGFAAESTVNTTATGVAPRSAYSFAKVSSTLDLDGSRGLDMEARGANSQDAGLLGVVLFSGGDLPLNGNFLPGYAQAFFPTFEGFSQVAEKCGFNQTESKETPECREQDGPYALARVVPDQAVPKATGIGRTQEGEDTGGDARSQSVIEPQPDGTVRGFQSNSGSDQQVPGTPIMVDSYIAEQTVVASIGSATADVRCEARVSVGGQPVGDNESLQGLLAPLTIGSDLKVTYEPPTKPTITQLPGGGLEASCRGPRFTVFASPQGGTGSTYTYGRTTASVGVTENREPIVSSSGSIGGEGFAPLPSDAPAPPPATGSTSASTGTGTSPSPAPAGEPDTPTPTVPIADDGPLETASGQELVRRSIDALPIGAFTAAGGALLALGIWLLLGVTGSLARGLTTLKLPPFKD